MILAECARSSAAAPPPDAVAGCLTLTIGDQLCALPVPAIRDILGRQPITRIPLAPPAVAGSLNLRGRIVTAIDLRRRLGLPALPLLPPGTTGDRMSVVVERAGELYCLLADTVGEVVSLPIAARAPNPPTLDPRWRAVSFGIHRPNGDPGGRLLILLNVERLLALG